MSSSDLQQTPEFQAKHTAQRKKRQKLTKASRRITRQKGQTRRPVK